MDNYLSKFNSNATSERAKKTQHKKLVAKMRRDNQATKSPFKPNKRTVPKDATTKNYDASIKPLEVYDKEYKSTRITLLQLARINAIQDFKGFSSRSKTIKYLLDRYFETEMKPGEKNAYLVFTKAFIRRHK